ncbi:MAG: sigma-70 family RNA polymerase sigma factor [Parcubacteria group bacterium]
MISSGVFVKVNRKQGVLRREVIKLGKTDDIIPPGHVALVEKIAKKLVLRLPEHVLLEDLVGEGWVGYFEAKRRYDPERGVDFEAFAKQRVRGSMLDYLRSQDPLSRSGRAVARKIEETITELAGGLGRSPEDTEVAEKLEMPLKHYLGIKDRHLGVKNISWETVQGLRDEYELFERREEGEQRTLVDLDEALQVARLLEEALDCLNRRERLVVKYYYLQGLNLSAIGEKMGFTEARACQLRSEAVRKLRPIYEAIARADLAAKRQEAQLRLAGKAKRREPRRIVSDFGRLQTELKEAIRYELSSDDD